MKICLSDKGLTFDVFTGDFVGKAVALGGSRIHTCNLCDYLTNKMSNIKQHLRGVHKQIDGEGFTTVMKSDLQGHNSQ